MPFYSNSYAETKYGIICYIRATPWAPFGGLPRDKLKSLKIEIICIEW